jgi:flavorubredoxin
MLGEFGAVKVLPAKHDVIVSGNFTMSKEAFQGWSRRGGSPKVVVMYRDADGRALRENVQLSRRPMLPPPTGE